MPFIKIPGFKGLVYQPEVQGIRKNNCPDCFFCQMCSDERCAACLKRKCNECRISESSNEED